MVNVRLFKGFYGFFDAVSRSTQSYLDMKPLTTMFEGIGVSLIGLLTVMYFFVLILIAFGIMQITTLLIILLIIAITFMYALGFISVHRSRYYHDSSLIWQFAYPLPVILLGIAVSYSAFRKMSGGKISWRGREYVQ